VNGLAETHPDEVAQFRQLGTTRIAILKVMEAPNPSPNRLVGLPFAISGDESYYHSHFPGGRSWEPAPEDVLVELSFASAWGLLAGVGLLANLAALYAQPATPASSDHVLELGGMFGCLELPPNIFNDLDSGI
jgi:hypothetical protein